MITFRVTLGWQERLSKWGEEVMLRVAEICHFVRGGLLNLWVGLGRITFRR